MFKFLSKTKDVFLNNLKQVFTGKETVQREVVLEQLESALYASDVGYSATQMFIGKLKQLPARYYHG